MNSFLAFGMPGGSELIVILVVILLLFGAKKIPELARGLGTGIKEFKKATANINDEIQHAIDEPVKTDSGSKASPQETASTGGSKSDASPKA
ncbi:MAG TPA: twin-arginine translocase TatA/TatE family subunit [Verrucomicrobiota bacterium]|jgi:sec-independent protein translocase protein TatA|nr:twin-arginine translocase TatA/TatE family subunit [Verrucomicrobiota bacterium]